VPELLFALMPRLAELDARFIRSGPDDERYFYAGVSPANANGIAFVCPKPGCKHLVVAWFSNPPAGIPIAPGIHKPSTRHLRDGDSLDTLSLDGSFRMPGPCRGFSTLRAGVAE
jgi:hypothetical protein